MNFEDEKLAEWIRVPEKRLVAVEIPGVVEEEGSLEGVLARMPNLNQVLKQEADTLVFRLRKDRLSRPLFGSSSNTDNLLVKVSRKRYKGSGEVVGTEVEPIGVVCATHKFGALADYQVTDGRQQEDKTRLREGEKISSFLERAGKDKHNLAVPPMFASTDQPWQYSFRPNTRKVHSTHVKRGTTHVFKWGGDRKPPVETEMKDQCPKNLQEVANMLRALFNNVRPIWTVTSLIAYLKKDYDYDSSSRELRNVLPYIAFNYSTGPWRKAWVKYGFSPDKTKLSRFYQILDFRMSDMEKNVELPTMSVPEKVHAKDKKHKAKKEKVENACYAEATFSILPKQAINIYQLCDINIAEVRQIVFASLPETDCRASSGWFSDASIKKIRVAMKVHLGSLKKQEDCDLSNMRFTWPPPRESLEDRETAKKFAEENGYDV